MLNLVKKEKVNRKKKKINEKLKINKKEEKSKNIYHL